MNTVRQGLPKLAVMPEQVQTAEAPPKEATGRGNNTSTPERSQCLPLTRAKPGFVGFCTSVTRHLEFEDFRS